MLLTLNKKNKFAFNLDTSETRTGIFFAVTNYIFTTTLCTQNRYARYLQEILKIKINIQKIKSSLNLMLILL